MPGRRSQLSSDEGPASHRPRHIEAEWDPEAGVWVATSTDVPGLATEAETIEGLTNRLRTMIPELLEANGFGRSSQVSS